ncbi:Ppx/GppA phosphatase family protein [Butyrivibrio sp. WCD3002]|uniref:Ppx/GppA phosphatase family protein n=1 Tax=Butyrivibrio sp. WCD3002 TaxID=1280676 RepID=UPI0004042A4C|nr:HD domain-containing protein [Butyrivibrio sp. WCD3002]
MATDVFAAVDLGSYELEMKIYEMSQKKGVKEIDHVRHRIDLGTETYATGQISSTHMDELIRILNEYSRIMDSYDVSRYQAYGTSAMRETKAIDTVLELLRQRTGIEIDILSNSEQRFLDYKSVALNNDDFSKFLEKPTAIVDVGGGSIQISLFDNDTLVTTQQLRLGVLRLYSTLQSIQAGYSKYPALVQELVESQLAVFTKMHLKDKKVQNVILLDDYVSPVLKRVNLGMEEKGYAQVKLFREYMSRLTKQSMTDVSRKLGLPQDNIPLMYVSGLLVSNICNALNSDTIWAPGGTLCDGIAYEYAERRKYLKSAHDFEKDIVACAQNISRRYMGSKQRSETLQTIALGIFDSLKKIHGLGKRERLLLQICTILHDCGKYISMVNLGDCSYNIILSTEIIGLSHIERSIVANVVRFNHDDFEYYKDGGYRFRGIDHDAYLTIAKLTAILRIANGLDRTHKEKFKNIKLALKDNELVITVDTMADTSLERGLFGERAEFFEQVYGIKPVIRQKRFA